MKIKSIQIQNYHNNGKLYEIGKNGVVEIKCYEYNNMLCYSIINNKGDLIASLDDCPVLIEYDVPENEKPKQKELFETEKFNFKKSLIQLGCTEQIVSDFLKHRAKHKAANTETAFNLLKKQLILCIEKKATIDDCILKAIEKNWRGFKADWYFNSLDKKQDNEQQTDLKSW